MICATTIFPTVPFFGKTPSTFLPIPSPRSLHLLRRYLSRASAHFSTLQHEHVALHDLQRGVHLLDRVPEQEAVFAPVALTQAVVVAQAHDPVRVAAAHDAREVTQVLANAAQSLLVKLLVVWLLVRHLHGVEDTRLVNLTSESLLLVTKYFNLIPQ